MRQLGPPRNWAERNPDHDGWAKTVTEHAPPEFWLTQLAKGRRSTTKRTITKRHGVGGPASEQLPLWPFDV
jgi:hypothetical protein